MDFPVGPERFPCSPLLGSPAAVCIKVYRPLAQESSDPLRKAPPVTPNCAVSKIARRHRLNFSSFQDPSPQVSNSFQGPSPQVSGIQTFASRQKPFPYRHDADSIHLALVIPCDDRAVLDTRFFTGKSDRIRFTEKRRLI